LSRTYQTTPAGDVTDALVEIVPGDGSPSVLFRDTTVIHTDPSGGTGTYNVYVAYNFRPKPLVSYQLSASSPSSGSAQGTTVTLGPADLRLAFPSAQSEFPDSITVSADFGTSTGAYILRLYVEYTVDGLAPVQKSEVPIALSFDTSGKPVYQYPAFSRVPQVTSDNGYATATGWFPQSLYAQTRGAVISSHPGASIQFTGVMYTMTQIDDALYDYYYVLNGPGDPSTTRLDVPDFTNLTHGIGVIASTQIIVHELVLHQ
jgi:hypothetical protein